MKKLLSVLLCVLLCFSFVACIGNDDGGTDNSTSCTHTYDLATCTEPQKCSKCGATEGIALGHTYNSATCFEPQKCSQCGVTEGIALGHSYNPATCTEPQECSRCGATKGTALGHTTSTGTCTRCGTSFSKWIKRNYVDEFDNPTGEVFISPVDYLSGKFSNSATTNSKLTAYIRVDDSDFQIMLWEYGSSMVKASSTTNYDITILLPNGTKKYFTGKMYKSGNVICFDDYNGIITLLKNNNAVLEIYVKEDSKYGVNSTYLFKVDTTGFKDLYNKTFN